MLPQIIIIINARCMGVVPPRLKRWSLRVAAPLVALRHRVRLSRQFIRWHVHHNIRRHRPLQGRAVDQCFPSPPKSMQRRVSLASRAMLPCPTMQGGAVPPLLALVLSR